jgi:hypothetical protein
MAVYGTLRTWARILGYEDSARLLEETLDEEEGTDSALTGIAQQINPEAAVASDTGDEETGRRAPQGGKKSTTTGNGGRRTTGQRQRSTKSSTRR